MGDLSTPGAIRVGISSPPDRSQLVADLFVGNEQMAEVNVEHGSLAVEIYPQRDGRPWLVDFEQLVDGLQEARARLGP